MKRVVEKKDGATSFYGQRVFGMPVWVLLLTVGVTALAVGTGYEVPVLAKAGGGFLILCVFLWCINWFIEAVVDTARGAIFLFFDAKEKAKRRAEESR